VLLAVAVGLLYAMSFGLVVLFEHLQRTYRRRRALIHWPVDYTNCLRRQDIRR